MGNCKLKLFQYQQFNANLTLAFSRAAHIMDQLETEGIVSELSKLGKRQLLITEN